MDRHGYASCTPVAPEGMPLVPFIDLMSGYVRRSLDQLPQQGSRTPWRLYQNYPRDVLLLRHRSVADPALHFEPAATPRQAVPRPRRQD